MNLPKTPPKGTLVAAVAFDAQTDSVVATACALSRRFDMEVHFLHVAEADPDETWVLQVPAYYTYLPYLGANFDETVAARREQMAALVAGTKLGHLARGEVLTGIPDDAIIEYSKLHRANLLVTSCAPYYGELVGPFSTTLSLMANAPLPLLVVDPQRLPDFSRESMRLLVADDLRPGSVEAVRRTYELAAKLGKARVRQVHAYGKLRPFAGVDHEELAKRDHETRRQLMIQRGEPYRARAVERGVEIELDLPTGRALDAIKAAIEDFRPDVLVMGRHRLVKTRPFLVGQVPFRHMLRGPCATMIVPPEAELHANLPFPTP